MNRPSLLLGCLLASAAPAEELTVRVLERERLVSAELAAGPGGSLSCDGAPLPGPRAKVEVLGNELGLEGGRRCGRIESKGEQFSVAFGEERRRWAGRVDARARAGRLLLLDRVEPEAYLRSVVAGELAPAPAAALEAQAVVSRTFALAGRGRHGAEGYDLCDLTHCQLYRGLEAEQPAATAAVSRTRGEVLRVGGVMLRPAFFHASCGGATSSAQDVFGEEGLTDAQPDLDKRGGAPSCKSAADFRWEWRVGREELAAALGQPPTGPAFEPLRRDRSGRVFELRSFGLRLSGTDFASRVGHAFGYQKLRSLKARAEEAEGLVRFQGEGLGHGVGLCQEGAKARASRGDDRVKLLRHYFPSSRVGRAD